MSDQLDEASEIEIAQRHSAIQDSVKQNLPQTHPDFDGESCLECGDSIPAARLAMGKIRCVYCQGSYENKRRYFK